MHKENTSLLSTKDMPKIDLNFNDNKIIYWVVSDDKTTKKPIKQNEVFKEIITIGKSLDILGSIEQKEPFTEACKKVGGKKHLIRVLEEDFIINALLYEDKENEYGEKITNNKKTETNKILKHLKKLTERYGLKLVKGYYEQNLIEFLANIHLIYEFNNIFEAINNNNECSSKIWDFIDNNSKKLDNTTILSFTKYYFNELFNINPIIQYDDTCNSIVYCFSSVIEISIFKMFSLITTCGFNLKAKPKTKICSYCGYIFIPNSNNQSYCKDCTKIATRNRKRKQRNKEIKT